MYGNSIGTSKQANTLTNDMDDDDDYENANPCDSEPVVPSRKTRRIKNAMKEDLALKCMEKPAKQAPSVWTTPQKEVFPKQTPSFQPPPIGLDFSSGAVNAAFSDIEDMKTASTFANNTFSDLEVMPNRNKQRCGRSMLVVLMWLMFIMFIAFGVITGFIFLHYFQKNSEEEQGNLKTKVANLSNTMGNLQDTLMANIKHTNKTLDFQKNFEEEQGDLKTKVANLSNTMGNLQDTLMANSRHINKTLDFQKNSEEEQGDLKTKVANLSNTMGNLQDTLMANSKHINKTLDFQKNSEKEQGDLKTKVANLSNMMGNLQDTLKANIKHINKTLETVCTRCPVGWSVIGSSCYFVSREEITWDSARNECYRMNSVLVMIKDKTESDSLKQLYNINKRYWIGLRRDLNKVYIWKWLDGTQVTFTNWAANEPNYHGKEEDCGETISGPWNDRPCSNKLFYICKRVRTC
ncbi:low affinity immunoglobulin epsilon Fc receptor-like [Bufo gargarizans]|uniref:low affinity immunoglobulin epsilon Fc receptor-like n=1 Tax=Bufo gargarizans TaxID=30331 RepID=UPI001CF4BFD7|nr:low affinity immunoglobulin epsilon Fc receptor-like [Bufo gargarizans]